MFFAESILMKYYIVCLAVGLVLGVGCEDVERKVDAHRSYQQRKIIKKRFYEQFENDPAIVEHIGDVSFCELDLGKTNKEAESLTEAGERSPLAFVIKGSKGDGILLLMPPYGEVHREWESGTLVLLNGKRIALKTLGKLDASIDLDLDIGALDDENDLSTREN